MCVAPGREQDLLHRATTATTAHSSSFSCWLGRRKSGSQTAGEESKHLGALHPQHNVGLAFRGGTGLWSCRAPWGLSCPSFIWRGGRGGHMPTAMMPRHDEREFQLTEKNTIEKHEHASSSTKQRPSVRLSMIRHSRRGQRTGEGRVTGLEPGATGLSET